jgi:hypothetical protein
MCGVYAKLKNVLVIVAAITALVSVGCSSSSSGDEGTAKPGSGVALNPGGKPVNADQAAYASQMQKVGSAMNAQRDKDAQAMAAAKARAGVK